MLRITVAEYARKAIKGAGIAMQLCTAIPNLGPQAKVTIRISRYMKPGYIFLFLSFHAAMIFVQSCRVYSSFGIRQCAVAGLRGNAELS